MMLSKSSAFLRTISTTRAFSSTSTTRGSARKMQKLFIDYLDEAHQRSSPNGRQVSSSAGPSVDKSATKHPEPTSTDKSQPKKMQKIFIEYLDDAIAKVEAKKNQKST